MTTINKVRVATITVSGKERNPLGYYDRGESKLRPIHIESCKEEEISIFQKLIDAGAKYYTTADFANSNYKYHTDYYGYAGELPEFDINNGVLVGYYGDGGEVVIPEGVTEIDEDAFNGINSIVKVTIPDSVTKIGACAFEDCRNLVAVTILGSEIKIGRYAFSGCKNLAAATIPENAELGVRAFDNCPCEDNVRSARKKITLHITLERSFWTLDNGWDYSPAEGRLEDIQLDCTLPDFLADPKKYVDDHFDLDELADEYSDIIIDDWDTHQLQKGEDIRYTIRFYDPYDGDPFERFVEPIAETEFLYTDQWEPEQYYDADGNKVWYDEDDEPFYYDADGKEYYLYDDLRFYFDDEGRKVAYDEDGDKIDLDEYKEACGDWE